MDVHDHVVFLLNLIKSPKSGQNSLCCVQNKNVWMQKCVQICWRCKIWIKFKGLVHKVEIVCVSMMLVFCYKSLNGMQSGFLHLYWLVMRIAIGFCYALAKKLPINIRTTDQLNLQLRPAKCWISKLNSGNHLSQNCQVSTLPNVYIQNAVKVEILHRY